MWNRPALCRSAGQSLMATLPLSNGREKLRTMDIGVKDMLEIFVEGDEIILKKYHPSCIFCSDARDVVPYKGKLVCKSCLAELRNAQD